MVGVTAVDGSTSSPVRTSLLVLGSTNVKPIDVAFRDGDLGRATETCGSFWNCC